MRWERYESAGVAGDVRVFRGERDLYAYLPPSHGSDERSFPVLYMHDGLNLFDDALANDVESRLLGHGRDVVRARPTRALRLCARLPRRRRPRGPRQRDYVAGFKRMRELLERKEGIELHAVLEHGGTHHETAWARRLPDALRFLLAG